MNPENEGMGCTSSDDELSDLDKIIKEEAEEYERDSAAAKYERKPEQQYLRTPEEEAIEKLKLGDHKQNEHKTVDDKTVQAEAKEGLEHEGNYLKFREKLPHIITQEYFKVYTMPTKFESKEDEQFIKEMYDQRKAFIESVIIYRDGRYKQHLDTSEGQKTIEDKIKEYDIRKTNPTVSEPLSSEEETDYAFANAILNMSKALDEPEHKKQHLRETRRALQNIGQETLVESLDVLYTIIQTIETKL
ncbi:hypothetical protein HY484_02235 [Candidatus Woesearchaeota archaeon]|nr:hypothetical protein [Candidatus Woesearchaeota archaeon]